MALSNWITYDPFFDVRTLHNQVDDVFNGFINDRELSKGGKGNRNNAWMPLVDVKETDKGISIHAELPGIKKEDIHLDVSEGILTLSGEKKSEKKEENERYHRYVSSFIPTISSIYPPHFVLERITNLFCRVERSYGKFMRSFALPKGVDSASITAEFKDGVLDLTVPKPAIKEPERKKIEIK